MIVNALLVMLGGAFGALARYLLGIASAEWWVHESWPFNEWPLGTFLANVLGGLFMGLVMGLMLGPLRNGLETERLRLLIATGLLGGFTTFSSFSLEAVQMLERRAYVLALLYIGLSVALSIIATTLGFLIFRKVSA